MTSIVTNAGALSALATLRTISGSMQQVQSEVATGARVSTAADNAAYWSISTTMSSDKKAISAVADALNLADAMVNVAYEGLNAAVDVLGEFKAKLIAGKEPGVDTAKVQKELDQLQDQMMSVATSASFNGQNWLNTSINDIFNPAQNTTSMVASFSRGANGVSLGTMEHRLAETSLFNSTGGGLLQADPRDPKTLGGIRYEYLDGPTSGAKHKQYTGLAMHTSISILRVHCSLVPVIPSRLMSLWTRTIRPMACPTHRIPV